MLLTEQLEEILKEAEKSKFLTELDLGKNILDDIPEELVAKPISKLKKVGLSDIDLSTEQLFVVLEETIKSESLLDLDLSYNNFDEVPAKLISKAISKLKRVNFFGCDLKL